MEDEMHAPLLRPNKGMEPTPLGGDTIAAILKAGFGPIPVPCSLTDAVE
jgi:hypothetical protein